MPLSSKDSVNEMVKRLVVNLEDNKFKFVKTIELINFSALTKKLSLQFVVIKYSLSFSSNCV